MPSRRNRRLEGAFGGAADPSFADTGQSIRAHVERAPKSHGVTRKTAELGGPEMTRVRARSAYETGTFMETPRSETEAP